MTIDQAMQLGLQHHQAGRLGEAEQLYQLVLQQSPNHPHALHLLGMLARRMGQLETAENLIRQAIAVSPTAADFHGNLGLVLMEQQKVDEAIAAYKEAIRLTPNYAQAHCNLGSAYASRKQWQPAADAFETAIQSNHSLFQAYTSLGNALAQLGQFDRAIAASTTAVNLRPDSDEVIYNLGNVLRKSGRLTEAADAYSRATQINPLNVTAVCDLGNVLRDQGQREQAMACYSRALWINPNHAEAHWNLSLTRLLLGDFEHGWVEHEWRTKCESLHRPKEFDQPRWTGEPLQGRTILLHAEQGFGDTLQFARYVPMVAARGGKVIVQCQPELCRLLKNLPGVSQVISRDQPAPPFDVQCPLMSLAFVLGTRLDSIPAKVPYLFADRTIRDDLFRIGLAWAGRPTHLNDHNRSMSLKMLSPLLDLDQTPVLRYSEEPGQPSKNPALRCTSEPASGRKIQFVSLQKNATETDPRLIDNTAELQDFADTAALVANLDLVITVDTAVAHLAGAMGKPVWVLLPHDPDWRWMLDREDSPWYPTMKLFRQTSPGDWAGVIRRVAQSLELMTNDRMTKQMFDLRI